MFSRDFRVITIISFSLARVIATYSTRSSSASSLFVMEWDTARRGRVFHCTRVSVSRRLKPTPMSE